MLVDPRLDVVEVEAGLVVDAAGDVRDRQHGGAEAGQLARGDAAHVAEALHDAALVGELPAQALSTRAR